MPVLDQYGGRADISCTTTGWFHTEKLGNRWWLCTPLGHVFQAFAVSQVTPSQDNTIIATVTRKYGNNTAWTIPTNNRLKSWNFNAHTSGAYTSLLPIATDPSFPLDSNGIHSQPVKIPFTLGELRGSYYAMTNVVVGSGPLLTNPVKNMFYAHSAFYPGFVPGVGVGDYYDSGIATWIHLDLTSGQDFFWNTFNASPYQNYAIGVLMDDGDQMFGFGTSPDFATVPPGHNGPNLSMVVATMAPMQTANAVIARSGGGSGFVYNNTQLYSKLALRNALAAEYGTIGALNTAWGSSYTTFDSSGKCVGTQPITCATSAAADSVGTGNGSTLTFSTTLSTSTITRYSLQILVAGLPVAGDIGNGTLYGVNASGTINYTTKALSLTFSAGHAPANGSAITATYVANGWEMGTGFLDEDNRISHNSYFGTDWIAMSNAHAAVKADMNTFLQAIAGKYFSDCATQVHATYPNLMVMGPDTLGAWGIPPPAPVLRAAGTYLDMIEVSSNQAVLPQAQMDYIEANFGDKPYLNGFFSTANPDSALSQYVDSGTFATQALRGAAYSTMLQAQLQTAHTTAGNFPYVGSTYWQYIDNWGEQLNWGMVTHLDNAYDGHEAATGTVPCSAPLQAYNCGNEPVPPSGGGTPPFGNLITALKSANALWLQVGSPIQTVKNFNVTIF